MSGFEDWQRVEQWTAAPLLAPVAWAGFGQTYGPFNIYQWGSLWFEMTVSSGFARFQTFQLNWYADQAATIQVAQDTWFTTSLATIKDAVETKGQWVTVNVSTNSALDAGGVWVLPARTSNRSQLALYNPPIWIRLGAVGAGGTVSQDTNLVTTGVATLTVATTGALWTATLAALEAGGAQTAIAGMTSNQYGAAGSLRVDLPNYPTRLSITNRDAGPANMTGILVPGR